MSTVITTACLLVSFIQVTQTSSSPAAGTALYTSGTVASTHLSGSRYSFTGVRAREAAAPGSGIAIIFRANANFLGVEASSQNIAGFFGRCQDIFGADGSALPPLEKMARTPRPTGMYSFVSKPCYCVHCVLSNQKVISLTRLSSIGDIISCRRQGLFGHVAWLDSGVSARDALKCAYAHHTEIRPPSGW